MCYRGAANGGGVFVQDGIVSAAPDDDMMMMMFNIPFYNFSNEKRLMKSFSRYTITFLIRFLVKR